MLVRTTCCRSGTLIRVVFPAVPSGRYIFIISQAISTETVDAVVISTGVVVLAVARALSIKGRDELVLETAPYFGSVTSPRNSEIIHANLYYSP